MKKPGSKYSRPAQLEAFDRLLTIMDELRELGCDYQQGYYISRPLDGSALIEWLQKRANDQQKLF